MTPSIRNRAFQFSLAWLVFWTFVCALAARMARSFVIGGDKGWDYLICVGALGIWLVMTSVAIYLWDFLQRRWIKSAAMRDELETLVQERRAERQIGSDQATSESAPSDVAPSEQATSSPSSGP